MVDVFGRNDKERHARSTHRPPPAGSRVDTRPDPVLPGPGGAVIEVTAAGICGSDLHFYEGEYPFSEPVALGHEAVGTVVEVGPDVRSVAGRRHGAGVLGGRLRRLRRLHHRRPGHVLFGLQIFGTGVLGGAQAELLAVPAADFQLLHDPGRHRHRAGPAADRQPGHRMGRRAARRHSARRHGGGDRSGRGRPVRIAQRAALRCRQRCSASTRSKGGGNGRRCRARRRWRRPRSRRCWKRPAGAARRR